MMEDSPYESFEPLDLPHVSTHGDEEPESSEPESSESITPESPNFTTEPVSSPVPAVSLAIFHRSNPPLHAQPGETSTDSTDNLDLDLPIVVRKGTKECANQPLYPLSHYVSLKHLSPAHKNFIADGSLERYKARLIAKGYTQTYGVDYQETFSPVAKMNTVRILLSLVAHYNWQLLQYDVQNAFLHGDLDEVIYMKIPPRFEGNTVMKEFGYEQSQGVHTFFIKHSASRGVTVLLVYVDDIIVTRNDEREKHELKQRLATEFEIKELGKLKYFLGKIGCKPVSTPMDPNHKLGEAKEEPVMDKGMYQRLVGNPGKGILFKKNNTLTLEAYTDADYAGSLVDRRSTTGYCTFLGDDLRIKWDDSMKLYCDNKSAINIAHNPIQHDRTKHIEIDRHFIKENWRKE
ncbi:Retrovirus-related Pol polyprotein from transposon RE1 [Vitis vinifera]|uniref:Retrovirus-related Pol polyprotein from transposon RE1 n=1 Tax=Vitis vinifera TaxID=29760 RepID=A0A438EDT8_VITVI|nr:Retrovirus-related Pol polyprotein from transposon RE1 [Vitis vinifera]